MCSIKWDEKFFEESGLYIWFYNRGFLESSNDRFHKSNLLKSFRDKQEQGLNNFQMNLKNERIQS
jgi:hypothetical protein